VSKKRGRSKQKPVQVQAVPEEVLAEGSGPVGGDASSIEVAADAPVMPIGDVEIVEIVADLAIELAPDEPRVETAGDAIEAAGAEVDPALEFPAIEDVELSAQDAEVDPELEGDAEVESAAMPITAASMDALQLKQLVEALVFAADKPITVQRLRQLTRVSDVARLEQALTEIAADFAERGLVLQQVSGGYQFRTRPQFSAWVQQLIAGRPVRLSRAQLETLAIIAYRQPITRPEIDDIRGVDSSATLKLLMDRMLIRVLGKKEEVGRPMLYGTTREFLDFFSLGDLRELPTLREYSELSDESRKVMSNRLGIDPSHGDGEGGEGGGGSDDSGGDDGGGSSGSGGSFGGGGEGGGTSDLDRSGGESGGEQNEISASALSDVASDVLANDETMPAASGPDAEVAVVDAPSADDAMLADEMPVGSDPMDVEPDPMDAETVSVDAETRQFAPIVVEQGDEDSETRDLDPVTETMTLADAPDLEPSQTRIVDPLIAAEALAHAETIVSSGESPE